MKYFLLCFFLCCSTFVTHAQAPAWQAALVANQAAGGLSVAQSTATDAAGNVYIAGNFIGTMTLGAFTLTSTTAASDDIFVAKWSPMSNSFVWAQQAGGARADAAYAVAVNGSNVYLTGSFRGTTASFGSITLTNDNTGGGNVMFVAKLTDAGNTASFTWALQARGAVSTSEGRALAVSGTSVYLTGRHFASSSFAPSTTTFGTIALTCVGSYDGFVTKLNDLGTSASFVWAQNMGGTDSEGVSSVAVNGANVYVAGYFESAAAAFGSITLATAGSFDAFIAKLTDAGTTATFNWAQRAGGTASDNAYGLAVSGTHIYAVGNFAGSAATFGPATLTSAGSNDIFVTKLEDAGTSSSFAWTQQAGGTGSDLAYAVAVSGSAIYVAGWFYSPTVPFGATTLTNADAAKNDLFVAKLLDAGATASFGWAQRGGGPDSEGALSIALTGTKVYVAGYAYPPTAFSSIVTAGTTGVQSALLASLADSSPLATLSTTTSGSISLYPNPAYASTTVQVPAAVGASSATLTLRDALGRVVSCHTAALPPTGLTHELSLRGLASGIYTLQVQAGEANVIRRLMVE